MEQLTTLKQRIQTVETIKKVTHAMRLIAMSSHVRLLEKKKHLLKYKDTFNTLWHQVMTTTPPVQESDAPRRLIIVVGSQKGLCGAFTSNVLKCFMQQVPHLGHGDTIIALGRVTIEHLAQKKVPLYAEYSTFSEPNFIERAQAITDIIITQGFQEVIAVSSHEKSFFVQEARLTQILPFVTTYKNSTQDLLLEQPLELVQARFRRMAILIALEEVFFESLLAEQAARFLSMDGSTRNAETLIASMKLGYNKIRQASITRELTELSASL